MLQAANIEPDAFLRACPSRALLARIGEKWALLTVACLASGPLRFGALKRTIEGVSQKMLTQTLRNLEDDGLVKRTIYDERPLRVEYALTPLAKDLMPIILELKIWAEQNMRRSQLASRL
jgi:DNA-binding HxlR family transcriptional regulator